MSERATNTPVMDAAPVDTQGGIGALNPIRTDERGIISPPLAGVAAITESGDGIVPPNSPVTVESPVPIPEVHDPLYFAPEVQSYVSQKYRQYGQRIEVYHNKLMEMQDLESYASLSTIRAQHNIAEGRKIPKRYLKAYLSEQDQKIYERNYVSAREEERLLKIIDSHEALGRLLNPQEGYKDLQGEPLLKAQTRDRSVVSGLLNAERMNELRGQQLSAIRAEEENKGLPLTAEEKRTIKAAVAMRVGEDHHMRDLTAMRAALDRYLDPSVQVRELAHELSLHPEIAATITEEKIPELTIRAKKRGPSHEYIEETDLQKYLDARRMLQELLDEVNGTKQQAGNQQIDQPQITMEIVDSVPVATVTKTNVDDTEPLNLQVHNPKFTQDQHFSDSPSLPSVNMQPFQPTSELNTEDAITEAESILRTNTKNQEPTTAESDTETPLPLPDPVLQGSATEAVTTGTTEVAQPPLASETQKIVDEERYPKVGFTSEIHSPHYGVIERQMGRKRQLTPEEPLVEQSPIVQIAQPVEEDKPHTHKTTTRRDFLRRAKPIPAQENTNVQPSADTSNQSDEATSDTFFGKLFNTRMSRRKALAVGAAGVATAAVMSTLPSDGTTKNVAKRIWHAVVKPGHSVSEEDRELSSPNELDSMLTNEKKIFAQLARQGLHTIKKRFKNSYGVYLKNEMNPFEVDGIWAYQAAISLEDTMYAAGQIDKTDLINHWKELRYYRNIDPKTRNITLYRTDPSLAGGGGPHIYEDDNAWVEQGLAREYKLTQNPDIKKRLIEMHPQIMANWDTAFAATGGVYWKNKATWENLGLNETYRSIVSNAPFISAAVDLFRFTGERKYLDGDSTMHGAIDIYNWVNNTLLADDGLYNDGVNPDGSLVYGHTCYADGSMMGGAVSLYEVTHEDKYLKDATRIAKASLDYYKDQLHQQEIEFVTIYFKNLLYVSSLTKDEQLKADIQSTLQKFATELSLKNSSNEIFTAYTKQSQFFVHCSVTEIFALAAMDPKKYKTLL